MATPVPKKAQRYHLLAYPLAVAEDPNLSPEAKARYINRLTALWAVRKSCPSGSIGHTDATKEIVAVTKEFRRDAGYQVGPMSPTSLPMVSSSSPVGNPADPARAAAEAALRRLQSTGDRIKSDSGTPAQAQNNTSPTDASE